MHGHKKVSALCYLMAALLLLVMSMLAIAGASSLSSSTKSTSSQVSVRIRVRPAWLNNIWRRRNEVSRSTTSSSSSIGIRHKQLSIKSSSKDEDGDTSSSKASTTSSASAPPVMRTCRVCHQSYDANNNHDKACRYHSGRWMGAERSKHYGVRSGGQRTGLSMFWDCCDGMDINSPGCKTGPHVPYAAD